MKQNSYEFVEVGVVPAQVLEIARQTAGKKKITETKRFRARNWRKTAHTGFAFKAGPLVVVVEENRLLHGQPAWGVIVTECGTIGEAVDGLYCHTGIQVGFYGHNVLVSIPAVART